MSKSYHHNDPYSHKYSVRQPHDHTHEFSVSDYLRRFEIIISTHKYNRNTDIINIVHMLEEISPHFDDLAFTPERYARFMRDIRVLCDHCPAFSAAFSHFTERNPDFFTLFFRHTRKKLKKMDKRVVCNILWSVACLEIKVPQEWMNTWYDVTFSHVPTFEAKDFYESLEALVMLANIPSEEWQKEWLLAYQYHVNEVEVHKQIYIFEHIHIFSHFYVKDYLFKSVQKKTEELSLLLTRDFQSISQLFDVEDIMDQEKLTSTWFSTSCQQMKNANPFLVIKSFLGLIYSGINIPQTWKDAFLTKMDTDFNRLSLNDMVRALYAMTLSQTDKDSALPFLLKCNSYLDTHKHHLFNKKNMGQFRKIISAKKYFKLLGFELHVDYMDHLETLKSWVNYERMGSGTQDKVEAYLKHIFLDDLESEGFVDEICDAVDFFIPSHRLVCEVDGILHAVGGKQNALTQLKTLLLEGYGFTVVRLDVRLIRRKGLSYIQGELASFIKTEKALYTDDVLQTHYKDHR